MRITVLLASVLLSMAAFGQTPRKSSQGTGHRPAMSRPHAAAPAVSPDEGSVDEHTYTSDYFGFRYIFPEGMGVDEDFMEGREDQSRRSFLLLAATLREETGNSTVMIMADEATASGATDPGAYQARVTAELLKKQGFQQEGTARSVTISGHSFARADFRRPNMAEIVLTTMLRGYAVNFVLMAPSREEVEELAGTLDTLEFAKGTAAR
jgi:hypothetical protein